MIRAQHARNQVTRRRNKRPKTTADLLRLMDYFDDADHPNHEGIRILPRRPWRSTLDAFVSDVESAAERYIAGANGQAGKKWCGDIAEHLIAAPDQGADLSENEVERMATRILEQISPRSPAVWAAHFDSETKTWEIHFAISSFTDELIPQLRVTDLRRREGADYGLLIDEAGFVALKEANDLRVLDGRLPVRSMSDIRKAKVAAVVEVISRHPEALSVETLSISEILALFQGSSWKVSKFTKTSVSLTSRDFTTPLHIRWSSLVGAVSRRCNKDKRFEDVTLETERIIKN